MDQKDQQIENGKFLQKFRGGLAWVAGFYLSLVGLSSEATTLRVLDLRPKAEFASVTEKILTSELANCPDCKFVNLTIYDENGQALAPNPETAWGSFEQLQVTWDLEHESNVLLLNWNFIMSPSKASWVPYLQKLQAAGVLIVIAAGEPEMGQASAPLIKTLAGALPGAFVIGELGEKDRLWGHSFFGPEMLIAFHPLKDYLGKGQVPVQFAAKLTKNFKQQKDWYQYLNQKKAKSKKIWLEWTDCFQKL